MGGDTYYDVLGITSSATPEEIRAKYRSLIRRVHPDFDGPVALFRQVQVAYEVLSDPLRRAEYDRSISSVRTNVAASATASTAEHSDGRSPSTANHGAGSEVRGGSLRPRRSTFGGFASENPIGALALSGAVLLVLGAALGGAGWTPFAIGCIALAMSALAGLGRFGGRKLEAYRRSGLSMIDTMSGREFEQLIGGLFVRKGYLVARLSKRSEHGAELLLEHAGGPTVVQIRRSATAVPHEAVQRVAAAMNRFHATGALVVTSSTYSPRALSAARTEGVTLWNRAALAAELSALQQRRPSTGRQQLRADLQAGRRVLLGAAVTALVLFSTSWRSVLRKVR